VLAGSARLAQEAREKSELLREQREVEDKRKQLATRRKILESQIAALHSELAAGQAELLRVTQQQKVRRERLALDQAAMGEIRGVIPADKGVTP